MDISIEPSWKKIIGDEFQKPYFLQLKDFLEQEIQAKKIIYPHQKKIFSAFTHTPFKKVQIVILGQDPYHGENQAHGLSFSIPEDQKKIPPSLQNIFKEIKNSYADKKAPHGNLTHWADQGVLLLNATLTVEAQKPGSHQNKGWENFTDAIIQKISDQKLGIIFILWGAYAQKKIPLIDEAKHTILTSSHPSPLSAYREFLGCGHFKMVNTILRQQQKKEIKW